MQQNANNSEQSKKTQKNYMATKSIKPIFQNINKFQDITPEGSNIEYAAAFPTPNS